jgi:hypothetical protein
VNETGELIALLDGFHITDRALLRARDRARERPDASSTAGLYREMRRYFAAVEREAAADLHSLDRKLDELYQRQYNIQAERGVVERRLTSARQVLWSLSGAAKEGAG